MPSLSREGGHPNVLPFPTRRSSDLLLVQNLDLTSGTLDGTGTVTVSNTMNWTAGTMSGSGRTIIPAGATLNAALPSFASLATRTLEDRKSTRLNSSDQITSYAVSVTRRGPS